MADHVRNFAGDLYADAGIWSPPTSAANFCEEDYAITKHIAEFINSLTNLMYIYFAFRYSRPNCRRADLMSVALCLVGICSFLYHMTLRQTAQFSDDISMLFLAGALIQRLYTSNASSSMKYLITTTLFAAISGMAAYYVRSGNLLLHTSMFAGQLTLIWPRTLFLIYSSKRPAIERAKHFAKFRKAVGMLVVAFVLWNIDLQYCQQLRDLRAKVGLPWAWILELHGWWHILTALGAVEYMELIRNLCP